MQAFVFPGQGAQFPGMGESLNLQSAEISEMMEAANDILGYDLKKLMLTGTEEELKQTHVTQPALFVHSLLVLRSSELDDPNLVAGHSLGEFSALVAAGGLNFIEGLSLVKERAEAMKEACDEQEGTMAAVIGLDDDVVVKICDQTDGIVVPANFNCPGQIVISGAVAAVAEASEACQEAGARRVIPLVVGGAFHSPLMLSAQERLQAKIEDMDFKEMKCPIVQNVDAKASQNTRDIKQKLIDQLTSPVRWTQTMGYITDQDPDRIIEIGGNGKVLRGLFRRFNRKLNLETL